MSQVFVNVKLFLLTFFFLHQSGQTWRCASFYSLIDYFSQYFIKYLVF